MKKRYRDFCCLLPLGNVCYTALDTLAVTLFCLNCVPIGSSLYSSTIITHTDLFEKYIISPEKTDGHRLEDRTPCPPYLSLGCVQSMLTPPCSSSQSSRMKPLMSWAALVICHIWTQAGLVSLLLASPPSILGQQAGWHPQVTSNEHKLAGVHGKYCSLIPDFVLWNLFTMLSLLDSFRCYCYNIHFPTPVRNLMRWGRSLGHHLSSEVPFNTQVILQASSEVGMTAPHIQDDWTGYFVMMSCFLSSHFIC